MLFRVVGANKETGEDCDVTFEAVDAAAAERIANRKGILVTSAMPAAAPAAQAAPTGARVSVAPPVAAPQAKPRRIVLAAPPQPRAQAAVQRPPQAPPPAYQPPAYEPPADEDPFAALAAAASGYSAPAPPTPAYAPQAYPAAPGYAPLPALGATPMAPPWQTARPKRSFLSAVPKVAWLSAGAAVVLLLLGFGAWALVGLFSNPASKYLKYSPDRPGMVMFVDFARFRASSAYRDFEPQMREALKQKGADVPINPDDVEQMFIAGSVNASSPAVVVIRTKKDMPLADLDPSRKAVKSSIDGQEVIEIKTVFATKLSANTYGICMNRQSMQDLLKRAKEDRQPKLDADFEKAMDGVKGEHHFMVMSAASMGAGAMPTGITLKSIGIGSSLSSDVDLRVTAVLGSDTQTETAMSQWEAAKTTIKNTPEGGMPVPPEAKKLIDSIKMSRSGDTLTIKASWKYSAVKGLVDQMKQLAQ